jgi:phenylpropionate dioxygenase-like ring-hydroxylating dioxygenase large terminal subunit
MGEAWRRIGLTDLIEMAFGAVADALPRAKALPAAAFLAPEVFKAETERLFRTGWIAIARASEVVNPGDYRVTDIAGIPLVVTRDQAGEIHVLSNICRHRGMAVMSGSGNAKGLTCPYHLWRYGLDGQLAVAPLMDGSEVFDRKACALPRIASAQWQGWVFANLSGDAEPLEPALAPLTRRVETYGLGEMVIATTLEFDSPWNWKIMVENFMESYHHIGPHGATLQQSNPAAGTYEGDFGPLFSVLENPGVDETKPPFLVVAIFPYTLIAVTEGAEPTGIWYEMDRMEADAFRLRIHILMPPDRAANAEEVAHSRELSMIIHGEDIPVCEGIHRGMASPFYEPGPLSPLEASVLRFHQYLKAGLLRA